MKALLACFLFVAALPLMAAHGQDQFTMNRESQQEFEKADAALNRVYKQLTSGERLEDEDREELKAAQRLWVQFRDAQAKFEADRDARGGSMRPQLYFGSLSVLTKARTETLRQLLKGN